MKISNNVKFGTDNLRSSVDINGIKSLQGLSSEESNYEGMIREQNENDEVQTPE